MIFPPTSCIMRLLIN
ncbi:hypothetical protein BpHYR1_031249 [Brachionus plicatilis]|uniref:Uncharacterized protein n=1 Tax=Brachionus plicatilis TaxID=10195 RepID=A0A3M7S065_BRAPC|nr:hypothetical protein BpHYR1_031249 [Brachionus plicatilis]